MRRRNRLAPTLRRRALEHYRRASLSRNSFRAFDTFGATTTAQYGFCGFRAK
jgi:hypothetical protein